MIVLTDSNVLPKIFSYLNSNITMFKVILSSCSRVPEFENILSVSRTFETRWNSIKQGMVLDRHSTNSIDFKG